MGAGGPTIGGGMPLGGPEIPFGAGPMMPAFGPAPDIEVMQEISIPAATGRFKPAP
jgi:hypothetical protein